VLACRVAKYCLDRDACANRHRAGRAGLPLARAARAGQRQQQLERKDPDFEDLDMRFYRFAEKSRLDAKMLEYIRANSQRFVFRGTVRAPASIIRPRSKRDGG
jgi:hypothetical protein